MDNTIKTFADGSEITAKQLIVACACGIVVGVGVRLGRDALKNRRLRKDIERIEAHLEANRIAMATILI